MTYKASSMIATIVFVMNAVVFSVGSSRADIIYAPISSFSGDFTSVSLFGHAFETGPIRATLAPGGNNVFGADIEAWSAAIDVDLMIEFPLLDVLGVPPPRIRIQEYGPILKVTGGYVAQLTGGGVIDDEGFFDGVAFTNQNSYQFGGVRFFDDWPDDRWITGVWTFGLSRATVEFPDPLGGGVETINGGGTLTFAAQPIPEPDTLFLLGTGLIGLLCHAWRQHRSGGYPGSFDRVTVPDRFVAYWGASEVDPGGGTTGPSRGHGFRRA